MRRTLDYTLLALDPPWSALLTPWGLTLSLIALAYLYGYCLCRAAADADAHVREGG
ncbi:MAG TPA: hypothetical protein VIK75_10240 [Calditerricola sp.]